MRFIPIYWLKGFTGIQLTNKKINKYFQIIKFSLYLLMCNGKGKFNVHPRTGHDGPEGNRGRALLFESVEITNKMQPCNRIYYSNVY